MPDWKNIGLAGKDVLMGVVTVVAGAEAGQAGAQGAQQRSRTRSRARHGRRAAAEATIFENAPGRSRLCCTEAGTCAGETATPSPPLPPSEPVFRESVVVERDKPPVLPRN